MLVCVNDATYVIRLYGFVYCLCLGIWVLKKSAELQRVLLLGCLAKSILKVILCCRSILGLRECIKCLSPVDAAAVGTLILLLEG
jgi:hypothetical protein